MSRKEAREFWRAHIEAYREGGMTQQAYCLDNHLKLQTFRYRLAKMREAGGDTCSAGSRQGKHGGWVPLAVVDDVGGNAGGVRIRIGKMIVETAPGFAVSHLSDVLKAVYAAC